MIWIDWEMVGGSWRGRGNGLGGVFVERNECMYEMSELGVGCVTCPLQICLTDGDCARGKPRKRKEGRRGEQPTP